MRRLLSIAAFLLVLTVAPVLAQHGGGHGSVGGHGGGFAAHGSFGGQASVGHVFSGTRSSSGLATRGFGRSRAFSRPSFSSPSSARNLNRFRGPIISNFAFRGPRFEPFGLPWWGGYYYDPWWWYSGSSDDADYENDHAYADQMNQQSLAEQQMRNQQDQDLYAGSAPPQPREEAHAESPVPPTVLVFRDQHKKEIQNYAIVGRMLWNFAPQRTEKIALADLDLVATTKANDERGVDFRVPGVAEGQ
jgi:hypothetical protein